MKRFAQALLVTVFLFLTACTPFQKDCTRSDVVCVGLVTDTGGLNDHGLTQSAWDGVQRALSEGLIQKADAIESVDVRDYAKNISTFTHAYYDVIITSGIGLQDETLQTADLYPGTVFIGLDQPPDGSRPNFLAVEFPEDQGGFLAGVLAAGMTQTGVIGAACETSGIASDWRACEGFRAGAVFANPDVKVFVNYRENGSRDLLFKDEAWGHDSAISLIREGADVIYGVGGGTGQGALVAAAEARVWSLGSEQDQFFVTREAASFLLSSVVPDASQVIYEILGTYQKGLPASPLNGEMRLAPYHEAERFVPIALQQKLSDLLSALSSGEVKTGVPGEKPK